VSNFLQKDILTKILSNREEKRKKISDLAKQERISRLSRSERTGLTRGTEGEKSINFPSRIGPTGYKKKKERCSRKVKRKKSSQSIFS
jgi:hypothetical protein